MGGRPRHTLVTVCAPPAPTSTVGGGMAEAVSATGRARWSAATSRRRVSWWSRWPSSESWREPPRRSPGPGRPRATCWSSPGRWADRPPGSGSCGAGAGSAVPEGTQALLRAHRRPEARLAEGRAARAAGVTAMIDVSDGLSIDLHRLADAVRGRLPAGHRTGGHWRHERGGARRGRGLRARDGDEGRGRRWRLRSPRGAGPPTWWGGASPTGSTAGWKASPCPGWAGSTACSEAGPGRR